MDVQLDGYNMEKVLTYIAYGVIGILGIIAAAGILKVLIHIGCMVLLLIFNQPIIALVLIVAVLLTLFLVPSGK